MMRKRIIRTIHVTQQRGIDMSVEQINDKMHEDTNKVRKDARDRDIPVNNKTIKDIKERGKQMADEYADAMLEAREK